MTDTPASFDALGLSPELLQAINEAGYATPTPIQAQAIPVVLQGRDVLGIAQTGTGKTASFTLPMIDILSRGRAKARMPRTLILEPTRELAAQVAESFDKYGKNHKLTKALLIGGVSFADQDALLTQGVDVLIATPGRLLDHFERGKLLLSGVQVMVVDEADRMLDMGFIPDIERIFKLTPFTRQTLFFSATMPPEITRLTEAFLSNPARIEASRPATTATTITARIVRTPSGDPRTRRAALRAVIKGCAIKNGIIFCNRKTDVDVVAKSLQRHGFNAAPIHGDLEQRVRMQTLDRFKQGELQLLVASDVAARGLDIPDVSHVFNYEPPRHADDYVHRIGRTGRAGRKGEAFTLVAPEDDRSLGAIEKLTGQKLEASEFEGVPTERLADDGRSSGRERSRGGRGRERGDGERRGRGGDRGERAPRAVEAAPGEEQAERPARAERPERSERGERPERAPREAREPRRDEGRREEGRRDESRRDEGRRDERRDGGRRDEYRGEGRRDDARRDDGRRDEGRRERGPREPEVLGFGDDLPAFLQAPPAPKKPSRGN
ncbi:MAG: DEAD/DEAH box helicase [Alphaproteobacteria bacterium]|nr:DEAD/DEAH box helicase [Alphaproteobacteria bacterium]